MQKSPQFEFSKEVDLAGKQATLEPRINLNCGLPIHQPRMPNVDVEMQDTEDKQPHSHGENEERVVFCTFSGIREQTPSDERNPSLPADFQKRKYTAAEKDMRCFFKGNQMTVVTRGGLKYVNNTRLNIEDVFPMEDGVLIKAEFNSDIIQFEQGIFPSFTNRGGTSRSGFGTGYFNSQAKTYVYLSLLEHPLNDAFPVKFSPGSDHSHIDSSLEVIYVAPALPFCILFDPDRNSTKFCLINQAAKNANSSNPTDFDKSEVNDSLLNNTGLFFRNFEQDSNGQNPSNHLSMLHKLLGPSQVTLSTQFEIEQRRDIACAKPDQVHVCSGLQNSNELVVSLYFGVLAQIHTYTSILDQRNTSLDFKKRPEIIENVKAMQSINFSRMTSTENESSIKIVSKHLSKMLQSDDASPPIPKSKEFNFFVKRLKQLSHDMVVFDAAKARISIYSGGHILVHRIEANKLLTNTLIAMPDLKVVNISNASDSNIQLHLSDGSQKRITLRHEISDCVVNSIMKVLRKVLPEAEYTVLVQDVISLFSQVKAQNSSQRALQDQFEVFGNFLLSLVSSGGKLYQETQILSKNESAIQKQISSQLASLSQMPQIALNNQQMIQGPIKTIQGSKIKTVNSAKNVKESNDHTRKRLGGPTSASVKTVPKASADSSKIKLKQSTAMNVNMPTQAVEQNLTQQSSAIIVPNAFDMLLHSQFHSDFANSEQMMLDGWLCDLQPHTQLEVSPQKTPVKRETSTTGMKTRAANKATAASSTQAKSIISPIKRPKSGKATATFTAKVETTKKKDVLIQEKLVIQTQPSSLQPFVDEIFNLLHLMYEDIKLNKLQFCTEGSKLRKLLFCWLVLTDQSSKTAFMTYYISEAEKAGENLKKQFKPEIAKHLQQASLNSQQGDEYESVPQIFKWIDSHLSRKEDEQITEMNFPVYFEQTRLVCRLYQILFQQLSSYIYLDTKTASEVNTGIAEDVQMSHRESAFKNILINKQAPLFTQSNFPIFNHPPHQEYLMMRTNKNLPNSFLGECHLFEKVLYCLKEEKLGLDELSIFPSLVSLPFLEIIRQTRLHQQDIQTVPWPNSLYKLIHREDIINNLKLFEQTNSSAGPQSSTANRNSLIRQQSAEIKNRRKSLVRQQSKTYALNRHESNVFSAEQAAELSNRLSDNQNQIKMQNAIVAELIGGGEDQEQQDKPGLGGLPDRGRGESSAIKDSQIGEFLKNKFGKDTRYREVEHMLSSTHDMVLKVDNLLQGQGVNQADQQALTDSERNRQVKVQLEKVFRRHLSKCVGRGALTLGTQETIPTETLQIPKISQTGYIPNASQNELEEVQVASSTVTLDLSREEREQLQWPHFHNGAASALRIAQSSFKRTEKSKSGFKTSTQTNSMNQARNWIMYHKPQEPKNEHGGFLLGIGLLGQLDSLQAPDLYQHLKSAHDSTTIGVLLGRAASQKGKMDESDTRMMCLHIPALLPQNLLVDINLPVQSAAVVSAGLLYENTSNRLISEMLLAQIARKPTSDKMIEREGYALASGISLGLVNLGSGVSSTSREIGSENLHKLLGIAPPSSKAQLQDLQLDERLIRFIEGGKTMPLPRSMLSNAQQQESSKSSAIKENEMVNVYVTSSAGLIALTLIHLKSNNLDIASRLIMPLTFYDLEFVRPQILLQKVLCRNLIMWDKIECTEKWLKEQIPSIITEIYESTMDEVEQKFQTRIRLDDIDFATVALCYVNIIAGATFSIGFKYAGTGNIKAKELIINQINFFRKKLKVVPATQPCGGPILTNTTVETKNQIDKNTVETCLCVLGFALGMVMAGTCDVDSFRQLRVLRKRIEGDMNYGYNMATNMAIGFLFLGSGAYTFSRSQQAIAALVCSTYPILPDSSSDNRHHLQALRHFYVMAIETRLLQARDIDTGRFVNIEVEVTVRDEATNAVSKITQHTPNIINGQIIQIEVKDHSEYHDVCLKVASTNDDDEEDMLIDTEPKSKQAKDDEGAHFEQSALQQVIYVKRKTYHEEPSTNLQTLVTLPQLLMSGLKMNDIVYCAKDAYQKIVKVNDPSIQAFLKSFGIESQSREKSQDVEKWLLKAENNTYCQLKTSILDLKSMSEDGNLKGKEILALKRIRKDFELHFQQNVLPDDLKRQLLTLIVLEECYVQDKVNALPLTLKLVDSAFTKKQSSEGEAYLPFDLLDGYFTFMRNTDSSYGFFQKSPSILPLELQDLVTSNPDAPDSTTAVKKQLLMNYIRSEGKSYMKDTEQSLIPSLLDPCTLQAVQLTFRQAKYLFSQQQIQNEQEAILIRQVMQECLKQMLGLKKYERLMGMTTKIIGQETDLIESIIRETA